MKKISLLAVILVAVSLPAVAQEFEIPHDGTPVTFELPPNHVVPSAYVNVPEGSQQLRVELTGEEGAANGLYVRFGSPFDVDADLWSQVDFYSSGPDDYQHLTITRASNPALGAGRWYIMPANWHGEQVELTGSVVVSDDPELDPLVIEVVYDSQEQNDQTGFFDPAPFQSGHNPGETLGEARRLAFERALEIAGDELTAAGVTSPVPVLVGARFEDLGGFEDDGATLAHAGPNRVASDFPGAYLPDTVYPGALVAKMAGTDLCRVFTNVSCSEVDVAATFNMNEEIAWSYALESVSSAADFVSTAMHEVMHGLGFLAMFALEDDDTHEAGDWLIGALPDAYSRHLVFGDQDTPLAAMDSTERMEAATSFDGLRWGGETVAASAGNPFTAAGDRFRMYAPSEVEPGSSVSHVDRFHPVALSELMRPVSTGVSPRNIGHTGAFLVDMGYGDGPAAAVSDEQPIHFGMSGLWFNPETGGQGMMIDVAATQDPPHVAMFWFTFADQPGGPESQRWYSAQGDYQPGDSRVSLTAYQSLGGVFDSSEPYDLIEVGEMELVFHDCSSAALSYAMHLDGDETLAVSGVVPLVRLSPDIACGQDVEIPGPPPAPITPPHPFVINYGLNGIWWEAGGASAGQGMLFDITESQDPPQVVLLWFTFAGQPGGADAQRWFIAQGDFEPGAREVTLDVNMPTAGVFDDPRETELTTVGTAHLVFPSSPRGCREATLSYEIRLDDDGTQIRTGDIALERLTADIICESFFDR